MGKAGGGGGGGGRGDGRRGPLRSGVDLLASVTMLCRRALSPLCHCGRSMHLL